MLDEDSGEPITCPECDSEEECEHLVALLDLTFCECEAGYASTRFDEFFELVRQAFQPLLRSKQRATVSWASEDVAELWDSALENSTGADEEPELDGDVMMGLVRAALEEADAVEPEGRPVHDAEGPGSSSALAVYYAADPPAVFAAALATLGRWLKPKGARVPRRRAVTPRRPKPPARRAKKPKKTSTPARSQRRR